MATELVNTAPGVWNGVDKLPDVPALQRFLATDHLGLVGLTDIPIGAGDVEDVHRLRTRLRDIIDMAGTADTADVVERAGELTAAAGGIHLRLDAGPRPRWEVSPRPGGTLADRLGLVVGVGVLGVVRTLGVDRFRPCSAPTCSGAFIDVTRPGRRRYCMPDICGNRVNVANHRARQRS